MKNAHDSLPATLSALRATVASFEAAVVTREFLLKAVEAQGEVKRSSALQALKLIDPACCTSRSPITYDRKRLLATLEADVFRQQAPRPRPAPAAEVKYTSGAVDATLDPGLTKYYPTRSYRQVRRRMNPNFPLNLFIYGETGVGKSTCVLYVAKAQGRTVVRANLSKFADVDDLFGGLRIVDGNTFFDKGPALVAMELGAILLLDECDSADPQLLTDLHPVLEHKGYLIKKTKQMIYPAPGFCVIATANTRGRGDLTGKYIGTNPLNAAFLDRFATGIEYLPPTQAELKRIINITNPTAAPAIVDGICAWYEQVSAAVSSGAVTERPSPRKIIDIVTLMQADGITSPSDQRAKDVIIEGTNLLDQHISQALAELWDSMLQTAQPAAELTGA